VSKPSGPAGQKLAPGKRVDELGSFRRFAGETLVTRFSGQEQTTLLPTVVGVCYHPEWYKEEEEEKAVVNDPVDLDFFVTETAILCREMRCFSFLYGLVRNHLDGGRPLLQVTLDFGRHL